MQSLLPAPFISCAVISLVCVTLTWTPANSESQSLPARLTGSVKEEDENNLDQLAFGFDNFNFLDVENEDYYDDTDYPLDAIVEAFDFAQFPILTCDSSVPTGDVFDPRQQGVGQAEFREKRQANKPACNRCLNDDIPTCNVTRRMSKPLFGFNPDGLRRVIMQRPGQLDQCVEIIQCTSPTCTVVKGACKEEYRLTQFIVFDQVNNNITADYILVPSGCNCYADVRTNLSP
ncbi:PREDICTED: uncharacterized protein LOC106807744 [Priapulus caudatus]|uniref:Uncharacterized protein LOC106807744 n=1 Tax=Priapulus caudatus TaxID=37621 RepID=A0ABM1E0G4_PRICU|nr:PREDICTED: uncharacterized protein LOC106807744 [Priapulus caudatus]